MILTIDFETASFTGSSRYRAVEMALLLSSAGGEEVVFNSLIRGASVSPDAMKLHGITTELCQKEGVSASYACKEAISAIKRSNLIVSHNIGFDLEVLRVLLNSEGVKLDTAKLNLACTMQMAAHRFGGFLSLEKLHLQLFGASYPGAHRALADARACARCYFEMLRHDADGR
jgi:DNA polymerase III epsilon subunit-like protein